MKNNTIGQLLGDTDIYLIDQILKNRFHSSETILDAGCGSGRNLHWFYNNDFSIYGIDQNITQIEALKLKYSKQKDHFSVSSLEKMNFKDGFFNHIICNAVLHFAKDKPHFKTMFSELLRVLKQEGSLFIRVASNIGIEDKIIPVSEGVYKLPDGTTRFLLTKSLFSELQNEYQFKMLEIFKTVNVNDLRSMTTLVLEKGKI
ncbi:MAG: class I SAM-dependent methyltransferase [Flavobacteriaceae bacterium]|nr:class I SAM-dependent methyltransferase [Flavobacteriaceae bacterium]